MRFERITVQNLLPTGNFLNIRLGADLLLDDCDDPKAAMKAALDLALEFHKEQFPHMYKDNKPTYQGEEEIPIIKGEKKKPSGFDHWISEIQKTTSIDGIDGLEGLRLIADSNPALKTVFDEQMKKLKQ